MRQSPARSASAADIIKKVLWTQLIVILSRTVDRSDFA
jgi:hypothetical protein